MRQSDHSGSNQHVQISHNSHPPPAQPPRYHISQYLNLMGGNPTVTSSLAPEERPAKEEAEQIIEHHDVPVDDNDDLPPLSTHPIPWHTEDIKPRTLSRQLVPLPGHCIIITPPPHPENPVHQMYSDWHEFFTKFHNCIEPNWGKGSRNLIIKESSDRTPLLFQTPPKREIVKLELRYPIIRQLRSQWELRDSPHLGQSVPHDRRHRSLDQWTHHMCTESGIRAQG